MKRTLALSLLPPTLLSIAGLWLLSGCLVVGTNEQVMKGRDASAEVGVPQSNKPLRTANATRSDVFRVLGQPDFLSIEGARPVRVGYRWAASDKSWLSICGPVSRTGLRTLVLTFDEQDVLKSFSLEKQGPVPVLNTVWTLRPPQGMAQNPAVPRFEP